MMNRVSQINLYGITMLLLPIIMIKILAVVLGIGAPTAVSASGNPYQNDVVLPKNRRPVEFTEQQIKAGEHAEMLHSHPFGFNPLLYAKAFEDGRPVRTLNLENFNLQMIMSFNSERVALIGGQQYREGDRIDSSPWIIRSIDSGERKVTLVREDSGQEMILSVESNP